ncbi:Tetraacyldisaccharide 4'-kinase [Marinobacter nitratireducens]|uniref:Tetraacyldisaccharide 4'-kinase n=1 Tax=Marinobacter nitratireducens TaxID=1137280 RepID=A0A072NGE3_9GAMM|nr:tetraacyldisaccharide 4'-kinase [Marinobacter nitratireducens]KEF32160.1 Tetraacyldisaccharide 4'-kinase [Marinobacter nitratireducens]
MSSLIDRIWYGKTRPLRFLAPLAWLYQSIAESRRRKAWFAKDDGLPVPVIVVGNITAGGTGKSPLTAWLVKRLSEEGWRPVIISRGYGGKSSSYPLLVTAESDPAVAGDEPVMLALATGTPVVVDPERRRAAAWALDQDLGNVLVCDDGLQHYRLPRDIELAVFDGERGVGNGAIIPVGPLREPVSRLSSVDFLVINGGEPLQDQPLESFDGIEHPAIYSMALAPAALINLQSDESIPLTELVGRKVKAVAGIGNPGRFFDTLRGLGAEVSEAPFPDHHAFREQDLSSLPDEWVVMTSKDAVKCRAFAGANAWVLSVEPELPKGFEESLLASVRACFDRTATTIDESH